MVLFVNKINVEDPRLNVLYCICVFVFLATFSILVVVTEAVFERVPVGENLWTRILIPTVEDAHYESLQKGFQRMLNEPICKNPQDYDYWWSTTYKYDNYSCIELCGLQELGNHCISRYEIIQAKDDLSFVIVTEIENDPLVSGEQRSYRFVPWDPETFKIRLYYGTITKDISWFGTKYKGSDEYHSSVVNILTVVQNYDGDVQQVLEPSPHIEFTVADILKWTGLGLDIPGPGANPNVKPGATLPRVTPRISGMNIKAVLDCFSKPPKSHHNWKKGPTCHIRFEHYAGPWVGEPYIRVVSSSGGIAGSYYHGTRISFVRNGYYSYPSFYLFYKALVDFIILSVWPKFFVLAVAIGCLGLKSKVYDRAIRQRFDIMGECKGNIARLLTYSLDFEVFRGATDTKDCVSRLVVAERLAEAMKEHKGTIDKVELLALVYFCHHAMMKTNPVEPGICQRFLRDLRESCGRLPPSELQDYYEQQQKVGSVGITSTQFNMCCCNDESIEFVDLCTLFDVDRKKPFLERFFCQSDDVVKAYADHAHKNFEDERDKVKMILTGNVSIHECDRINGRIKALEEFIGEKSVSMDLDKYGLQKFGSEGPVASKNIFESVSSLNDISLSFPDKFDAGDYNRPKKLEEKKECLLDENNDGIIEVTELEHVDWELHEGTYLEKGDDIEKAEMTIMEAKRRAKQIRAAGFCHLGPVTTEVTTIYFKNKVRLCPSPAPGSNLHWTTYVASAARHKDELLGAFKMFDRDNNGQVSMAEMNNVMTAVSAACLHILSKSDRNAEKDDKKANEGKISSRWKDERTDDMAWEEVCEACIDKAVRDAKSQEKVVEEKLSRQIEDAEKRAEKWITELDQHGLCPSHGKFKSGEKVQAEIAKRLPRGRKYSLACKLFRAGLEQAKACYTKHKVVKEIQVRQTEDGRITQIKFVYEVNDTQVMRKWGYDVGKFAEPFSLQADQGECITKIIQRCQASGGSYQLCGIKFVTNRGRHAHYGHKHKGDRLPDIELSPLRQIFGLGSYHEAAGENGKLEGMINTIETRLAPREATELHYTVPIEDSVGGETLHFIIEGTKLVLNIVDARVENYCMNVALKLKKWGSVRMRCVVDELHYERGEPALIETIFRVDAVRWKDEAANAHKECTHELDAIDELRKMTKLTLDMPWTVVGDLERMAAAIGMENNTLPEVRLDSRPLNEAEVAELLREVDDNGDGMVSYQEFMAILLNGGTPAIDDKDLFVSGEIGPIG